MSNHNYSNLEFLTGISYADREYVGLVINYDNHVLTFYDVENIASEKEKKLFLELGEIWWWESNRLLPIDIFLHLEMKAFRYCIKTFATKDVEILFGPTTSLSSLLKKRINRRSIQLVRKVD